jgi:hypothetical protein
MFPVPSGLAPRHSVRCLLAHLFAACDLTECSSNLSRRQVTLPPHSIPSAKTSRNSEHQQRARLGARLTALFPRELGNFSHEARISVVLKTGDYDFKQVFLRNTRFSPLGNQCSRRPCGCQRHRYRPEYPFAISVEGTMSKPGHKSPHVPKGPNHENLC